MLLLLALCVVTLLITTINTYQDVRRNPGGDGLQRRLDILVAGNLVRTSLGDLANGQVGRLMSSS